MIYTALYIKFLIRANLLLGQVGGGWALEISTFWALTFHRAQKVSISRALPPPACPRNGSAHIKNIVYGAVKIIGAYTAKLGSMYNESSPPPFCLFLSNLSLIDESAIGQPKQTTSLFDHLPNRWGKGGEQGRTSHTIAKKSWYFPFYSSMGNLVFWTQSI
jgi:hypothetical protein